LGLGGQQSGSALSLGPQGRFQSEAGNEGSTLKTPGNKASPSSPSAEKLK